MRIVDLSMTVDECDSTPFAPEEAYFKVRPIVRWEDKGFVSNIVELTVHAGTHIDSPHHFVRSAGGVETLPLDALIGDAIVLDLTAKGKANARIGPDDLDAAEQALIARRPRVLGFDFAQEEKGADYQTAGEILTSGMRVHRIILPKIVYQIENLINLDQIPSKVKIVALPVKWKTESAPARVIAILD
ncbi:MAG: hypothetical protein FJZ38_16035 [Candidatus Rokubacteria bacterium]|nr:hypothetical protein [Candidatus Rokubacteria bacterium]